MGSLVVVVQVGIFARNAWFERRAEKEEFDSGSCRAKGSEDAIASRDEY